MGKICDISSGGVRFMSDWHQTVDTSSEPLALGTKVELSIDWPVLLDGACRLQLKGRGRIVRSDGHAIAIEFERYEFCTRKAHAAASFGAGTAGT